LCAVRSMTKYLFRSLCCLCWTCK